jgi:ribosomal protein S27E
MNKTIYQDVEWRGYMRWVKRGNERFLHVRCRMDYDAKGIVESGGHIVVDCGNCGEKLTISNGNSNKPFIHRCRREG